MPEHPCRHALYHGEPSPTCKRDLSRCPWYPWQATQCPKPYQGYADVPIEEAVAEAVSGGYRRMPTPEVHK